MAPSDDTTCLDCGYTFPLREGAGPCLKCKKLANHSLDSPEYQDLMVRSQHHALIQSNQYYRNGHNAQCVVSPEGICHPPAYPSTVVPPIVVASLPAKELGCRQVCIFNVLVLSIPSNFCNPGSGPLTTSSAYNASGTASEPNQLRAAATATRLRRAGFQPSQAVGSSRLTTSRLQDHQHGGGAPGEAKTYICFQVCSK